MSKSYDFPELIKIMERLRSPEGCPWDKEQTHESILNCLVEESAEFIDAVLEKDVANMREELGDLLLQVVFHSQMAREAEKFDIHEVIEEICAKLIRRHPHVFGEKSARDAADVLHLWEEVKREEKSAAGDAPTSALDGVPVRFEPLLKAEKLQKKAAKVGFDWQDFTGPLQKIKEETGELESELASGTMFVSTQNHSPKTPAPGHAALEEELGDLLFSVVNLSRHLKVNPAVALEKANLKFAQRFKTMEEAVREHKKDMREMGLAELDLHWDEAKKSLTQNQIIDDEPQTKNQ